MRSLDTDINDRGSRYAVSGGPAADRAAVQAFLRTLKRDKHFARASHNSWAVRLTDATGTTPLKGDDGEAGAGNIILRMIEAADLHNHVIVVTRWYGGKPLGGDRFRHVQTATRLYLSALS